MTHLAPGIAHVSFSGGGLFFVAREASQRKSLITEVATRLNSQDLIQVLLDEHRWLVRQDKHDRPHTCARCGRKSQSTCHDGAETGAEYCLSCAFARDATAA